GAAIGPDVREQARIQLAARRGSFLAGNHGWPMIQCAPPVTPQPAPADPRAALALQLEQAFVRRDANAVLHLGNKALQLGRAPLQDVAGTRGIGFVFPSGVVLGHTEVLFRLLENRDRALAVRIYSLGPCRPDFLARAQALGVPVEAFTQAGGTVDRLRWLRA